MKLVLNIEYIVLLSLVSFIKITIYLSQDVVAEEFEHIMELLTWSRLGKTPAGKKELVQIVAALAFTPDDWHPEDSEYVDRIIQCSQHALPLLSVSITASLATVNCFINRLDKHLKTED